jgi:lipopolysaccharide/colanic/teichoic acid biosynthesis glycosyltransferase
MNRDDRATRTTATTKKSYDPVKRACDIAVSSIGLIVLSPVMLVTSIFIALKLGRPVVFTQDRPGRAAKIFRLYKFRSMSGVDIGRGLISDEQRLTSFGRALRSTSLDELPSLWNVLKGDMSLVGPRPLLEKYLDRYSLEQSRRHSVRPGVTGLAQVSGRNSLTWERKLALDVEYVDTRSFWGDARILGRTVARVFQRSGINAEGHVTAPEFLGEPSTSQGARAATEDTSEGRGTP